MTVKRKGHSVSTVRAVCWLIFLICFSVCQTAIGQQADARIKRYAFVVGVSEYEKAGLDNLKFGAKDAEDLKSALERLEFVVTSLIGREATKENIETRFTEFMLKVNRELGKQDIVLVYFSGHGLQKMVVHGDAQGEVETPFFCPCDCRSVDPKTLVSLNHVIDQLKDSSSERNILLVDACRNNNDKGAGKGEPTVDGSTVRDIPSKLNLLFSSSDGQRSWESDLPEVQQGVFTHVILEGLRGEAANNQGEIRWLGLANYVVENVPIQAERLTGQGTEQVPNLILNSGPPIVIGKVKPKEKKVVENKPPAAAAAPSPTWGLPEGSAPSMMLKEGFSNEELRAASEAWAKYLQVDVNQKMETGKHQLRLIPPGEFLMGSSGEEQEAILDWDKKTPPSWVSDEAAHRVALTRPFFLASKEVTVEQFEQFVAETGYQTEAESDGQGGFGWGKNGAIQSAEFTWRNPTIEQEPDHPVVNVSWSDAVAYCEWLTKVSRKRGEIPEDWGYRLPTEAEWEYCCRAGSTGLYSFGNDPEALTRFGNVLDATYKRRNQHIYRILRNQDGYVETAPVGKFSPNRFGLFDMHGNVWEWCQDWYGKYPTGKATDPSGPPNGPYYVFRGGSWITPASCCRSADRAGSAPEDRLVLNRGYRSFEIGFRVALSRLEIQK